MQCVSCEVPVLSGEKLLSLPPLGHSSRSALFFETVKTDRFAPPPSPDYPKPSFQKGACSTGEWNLGFSTLPTFLSPYILSPLFSFLIWDSRWRACFEIGQTIWCCSKDFPCIRQNISVGECRAPFFPFPPFRLVKVIWAFVSGCSPPSPLCKFGNRRGGVAKNPPSSLVCPSRRRRWPKYVCPPPLRWQYIYDLAAVGRASVPLRLEHIITACKRSGGQAHVYVQVPA